MYTNFPTTGFSPISSNFCGPDCSPFCFPGTCSTPFNSGFGWNNQGWNAGFNGFGNTWNTPFNSNSFGWNTPSWNMGWNPASFGGWNSQNWSQPFNGFGSNFGSFSNFGGTPWNWNSFGNVPFNGSFNWNAPFNSSFFGGFNQFPMSFGGSFAPSWNMPFGFIPFGFGNTQNTTPAKGGKKSEGENVPSTPFGGVYPFPFGYAPFGYFNPAAFGQCEQNCAA